MLPFVLLQAAYAQNEQLVRLAKIQIDSIQLKNYKEALREEIEASIRLEPGVLTLCAVTEKKQPTHVTIFETYATIDAYKAHLETPHFKKYKTSTMTMVRALDLVQTASILRVAKPWVASFQGSDLIVQMAKLQIEAAQLEHYKAALKEGMETSMRDEPGVLTLYAVAEKENPTHISVLEIYANAAAYKAHLEASHFKKYKIKTARMVTSLELVQADPILLGAKP